MDTKRITEPERLVSAYLQRPIRSYEEATKARKSVRSVEASYTKLVTDYPVDTD